MASVWRWLRTLERTLHSNITASLGFIFCHEHYFVQTGKSHREDSFAPFSSVTLLSKTCSKVWVGALSRGNTCRLVLVPNVGQRENKDMCDHVGGSPDRTDNNTKYDSQQGRYHTSVHLLFQIQYNSIPPPPLHQTTYLEMYSFVHFTPSSFCQDTEPPAGWCWITSRPRNVLRWWWQGYRVTGCLYK